MPLFYDDETKRYITITYGQLSSDWSLRDGKEKVVRNKTNVSAEQCTKEHFVDKSEGNVLAKENGEDYIKFFDSWERFSILCPNQTETDIMLSGSQSRMESQALFFQVDQCNNDTYEANSKVKCHSQEEIEAFLKEVTVETWANYGKIDYTIHESAPFIRYDHWIRTDSLI